MAEPTLKIRILEFLETHPTAAVKSIYEALKDFTTNYDVISAYVQRMQTEELIKKVSHGKYSNTEKGTTLLREKGYVVAVPLKISAMPTPVKVGKATALPVLDINLEDIKVIAKLKEKYGKQRLIEILNEIRNLIE